MNLYRSEGSWQRENNAGTNKVISSDPLAVIYNEGAWRLNKVSPLYNLNYKTVKLKQYASKVRQALVSAVPASSLKYVVQIEEQMNLRYSEEDASGLILNVLSSAEDNSKSKISYSAILLSWGVTTNLDNATHLPYMLERGEQKIGTAVKATLQKMFDCNIKQFCFTQQQLLQFGFNFVENDSSRSKDPFTLIYSTPQADHKNKMSLSFEVGDIHIIWNGIKDQIENKLDLVTYAYQVLQNQTFKMIMLDITVFDLCEVSLPKAEAKSNGVVKMKTPEIVNCVFTVLNEICNDNGNVSCDKDLSSLSEL